MTEEEEIEEFIKKHGVKKCPTVDCVAESERRRVMIDALTAGKATSRDRGRGRQGGKYEKPHHERLWKEP
jgi:hypothetical protein